MEEKEKEKLTCCFCGKTCEDEFGNSPYPAYIDSDMDARCCISCNATIVIPARINAMIKKSIEENKKKGE